MNENVIPQDIMELLNKFNWVDKVDGNPDMKELLKSVYEEHGEYGLKKCLIVGMDM